MFLGMGPMAVVEHVGSRVLVVGAPAAREGAGALLRFDDESTQLLGAYLGEPGEALGAAIAAYPAGSPSGYWEAFVGAPGYASQRGRVYATTWTTGELRSTIVEGVEPGDRSGSQLALGEPGELYVGATGVVARAAAWPGAWVRTIGWDAPAPRE